MATEVDFLIIGGGAAGLSAASYAARAGLNTVVLEAMATGGQLMIIDNIENYPGIEGGISGFDLAMKFESKAAEFGADIRYAEVSEVKKEGSRFIVSSTEGEFAAYCVLFATGAVHRNINVPGEEQYRGHGVSYCATCDGPFFKNKKMLVVGGGDSAVQEALYLCKLSDKITIIHRRDRFRAQAQIVEKLKADKNAAIVLNTAPVEIKGDGKKVTSVVLKDTVTGKTREEEFDAVFGFVGTVPQSEIAQKAGIEVDKAGYILTDANMQTCIPGIFAAGDVRSTPFRQVVTACSDGAVAAHKAQEYIDAVKGTVYSGL